MRSLEGRVARLEERMGSDRSGVISSWDEYGRALAQGRLHEMRLTPEMAQAARAVLEQKLRELVRSQDAVARFVASLRCKKLD